MPRINVDSDYFDHPKTHRLKVYCGEQADIYPIRLWSFCSRYFPRDGILAGYTGSEIERILGWTGHGGNLIRALEQVGFVIKNGEEFEIKDWKEHAGFIWKYKRAGKIAGKKSGESRRLKKMSIERSVERNREIRSTMELNGMELKKDKDVSSAVPAEPAKPEPIVMVFPTVGKAQQYDLTESVFNTLKSGFEHLDVLGECAKALAWCELNPKRRKTAGGMRNFLFSWMARAQNRGSHSQRDFSEPRKPMPVVG